MSGRPRRETVSACQAVRSAAEDTSARTASAAPFPGPAASSAPCTSASASAERAQTETPHPPLASSTAMARPSPLLAAATIATFPVRPSSIVTSTGS